MIDIKDFIIDFNNSNAGGIYENIKNLFSTPVDSVAFDRDFGIDWSIMDLPLHQAKGALTVEYIEKVKKYEPRARVKQVSFEINGAAGILKPKVVIEIVA